MYRAKPSDGIAWVTGASSGIGRQVAFELARRGYHVAISARRVDELSALAELVPGKISVWPCDITDRASTEETFRAIEAAHGPVVLAFLNAGTYFPDGSNILDVSRIMATYDINVGGTVNCLGPLVNTMQARGRGQVAINASVAGYGGLPKSIAYGSSKAALINMASALRLTYQAMNLNIQVVCPGFVKTPLTSKNAFPMPFIVPVEEAAPRICEGFETAGFEITFPRRLSWILKALNMLPYGLYFALMAKATAGRK